jgi:hypothetical protein
MKRAKNSLQIVEEFFNGRPLSIGEVAWRQGTRKMLADLVAKLAAGSAPNEDQTKAARLILALTDRRRGRPKILSSSQSGLASTIDLYAANFWSRSGCNAKRSDCFAHAFEEAQSALKGEGQVADIETLKRYFKAGIRDQVPANVSFARRVDRLALISACGSERERVEETLLQESNRDPVQLFMARLKYERGKRRLKRAKDVGLK